ncbi:MAG: amidase domain-containing protein [Ruminococcus sp.]|nr:amidase domain-containing protein [Ruminococcus sp.]
MAYNRQAAIDYAQKWALSRNPRYYDFENIGGDCTNFASQALFAGYGEQNYKPTFGWYYNSLHDRAPAWSSTEYLYNFLTTNKGAGPKAREVKIFEVQPGDLVQLSFRDGVYTHTPFITEVGNPATLANIKVAAHSDDSINRPLSTYIFDKIRFLHLL